MTTRRQLLKVKVSARPLPTHCLILGAPRDFQRQRSKKSRYVGYADRVDRADGYCLGCRGKNHGSCLRRIYPTLTHKTQGSSFATGLEVSDKRKRVLVISTGSKNVDGILGGQPIFPR